MEEINHNKINRQLAPAVLSSHFQHLLLIPVPQFALPEPKAILWHHRNIAGGFRIGLDNLCGCLARGHPVVELLCTVGFEAHDIIAQHGSANGRIVPKEAVPERRKSERDAGLRVAMRHLEVGALEIEVGLLVLAHAKDLLVRVQALETEGKVVITAQDWAQLSSLYFQSAAFRVFGVASMAGVFF